MKKIDLTGQRFGRLTVLKEVTGSPGKPLRWLCACDCGNTKIVRGTHLTGGLIRSCGCFRKEVTSNRAMTHGMFGTRIYGIWANMKTRCYKKTDKHYKDYGGRGITVCDKWQTFEGFYEDMGQTYQDGLSIDRIDNNGNYCKENCRWATKETQMNNMRTNHLVTLNKKTDTLANICKKYNLNYKTVHKKLKKGIPIEKII